MLLALLPAANVWADDAPAPPPQGVWIGKGQFGFLDSKGNSDAESVNGNIDLLRYDGAWKNEFYLGGLYGKSSGIVSAERWETRGQSNYTLSGDLFAFGAFRYEHDLFDGFEYQESLTGGLGYKIINTDDTKFTVQAGAGYRRLRPEVIIKDSSGEVVSRTPLEATGDADRHGRSGLFACLQQGDDPHQQIPGGGRFQQYAADGYPGAQRSRCPPNWH